MLTEGFVTLSDLLELEKIKTSKVIISEGKNYKYLELAKEQYAKDTDLSVLHIRNLGAGQLRTLFDFMKTFNQEKEFIFVWDHDYRINNDGTVKNLAELKASADKSNQVFIFENNTSGIVTKGIENLINKIHCTDYVGSYHENNSAPKNKDHFQKYVAAKGNLDQVLANTKVLFDFVMDNGRNHNL